MRASARDFKEAWEAKDIDALSGLLDPDAMAIGDGGGLVSAEPLLASGSHFGWPLAYGMSTRKVDLVRMLGGDSGISKSEVSGICADLNAEGGTFRTLNGTNAHRRGSLTCPTATTPRSASAAPCSRPASASWSPSRGPGWPTRPSSSSTRPLPTWTWPPRPGSSRPCDGYARAALPSSSPIGSPRWWRPTRSR
jgi:hypothetical protein